MDKEKQSIELAFGIPNTATHGGEDRIHLYKIFRQRIFAAIQDVWGNLPHPGDSVGRNFAGFARGTGGKKSAARAHGRGEETESK